MLVWLMETSIYRTCTVGAFPPNCLRTAGKGTKILLLTILLKIKFIILRPFFNTQTFETILHLYVYTTLASKYVDLLIVVFIATYRLRYSSSIGSHKFKVVVCYHWKFKMNSLSKLPSYFLLVSCHCYFNQPT